MGQQAVAAAAGASLVVSSVGALPSFKDISAPSMPDMPSMRNFSSDSGSSPVAKNQAPGLEDMSDRDMSNMDKLGDKIAARKAAKKAAEEKAKNEEAAAPAPASASGGSNSCVRYRRRSCGYCSRCGRGDNRAGRTPC